MNILLISPYHGGSHRAWADGYAKSSTHRVELLTLPARFWKWRMHGGAVTLSRRFRASNFQPDLILATDMLDLTTFLALVRDRTVAVKTVLYMHENQLTYPLPADISKGAMRRQLGERDQHYAFINYASMLAADAICFNSRFHQDSFFEALRPFLKHYPEYNELGTIQMLRDKSTVLPVGINFEQLEPQRPSNLDQTPLILWNQRWEYDKNPTEFFEMMFELAEQGVPFRLAVCGQAYGKRPSIFAKAQHRLADHIIHFGYADAARYHQLLWEADMVVSTAIHEFFGIGIIEAIGCNTVPILPNRLSYPELLPEAIHTRCLYNSQSEAVEKIVTMAVSLELRQTTARQLAKSVRQFGWQRIVPAYDALFENLVWVSP